MKKGISPIVAVVLLIAIAVIAAVGLYFWVGGLATKQPTPSTPVVIGAQRVSCDADTSGGSANLTVMIQNLDASTSVDTTKLGLVDFHGDTKATISTGTILASQQAAVSWNESNLSAGRTYIILSSDTNVGQAQVVC